MKIEIKQAAPDVFSLSFDGVEVVLDGKDLKDLLLQVTKMFASGGVVAKSGEERARDFLRHFKTANDIGVQKFLLAADQTDILVLLKVAEKDKPLLDKVYANMSERLRKILAEDLAYKFKNGISSAQINGAFSRLIPAAENLEKSGVLVYDGAAKR